MNEKQISTVLSSIEYLVQTEVEPDRTPSISFDEIRDIFERVGTKTDDTITYAQLDDLFTVIERNGAVAIPNFNQTKQIENDDTVKLINKGGIYRTYSDMARSMKLKTWAHGFRDIDLDTEGKVVATANHPDFEGLVLHAVEFNDSPFPVIVSSDGLEIV